MLRFLRSKTFWSGVGAAGAAIVGGAGLSDKLDRIKDALKK